jgi:hypothetical protein
VIFAAPILCFGRVADLSFDFSAFFYCRERGRLARNEHVSVQIKVPAKQTQTERELLPGLPGPLRV